MIAPQYDYGINEPRMQDAIAEIKSLVLDDYPDALFKAFPSSNVNGVYLRIIVDVEEPGDVSDLLLARMVEMHIDEELPIYPIPVLPSRPRPADSNGQNAIPEAILAPIESHDAPS